MSFKIGDKVVCIKGFSGNNLLGERPNIKVPIVGEVYIIEGFNILKFLYLYGLNDIAFTERAAFCHDNFRKVDEKFANDLCLELEEEMQHEFEEQELVKI